MRLSDRICLVLIGINVLLLTGPGMYLLEVSEPLFSAWLAPRYHKADFVQAGVLGLLVPLGIPLVSRGLDRWKSRCGTTTHGLAVACALVVWTLTCLLGVVLTLSHWVPIPNVNGRPLSLDRSTDLPGPDQDHNRIRDDIDAWIAAQTYSEAQRKAVQQVARAQQAILLADASDRNTVTRLSNAMTRSGSCLAEVFGGLDASTWDLAAQMAALTTNTSTRRQHRAAYDRATAFTPVRLPQDPACDP